MDLRRQLGSLRRRWLSSAYSHHAPLGSCGPIISFTFDDFPRTALTVGGRILKNYGLQGTYYTAIGLMNTSNNLGEQFKRQDLDTLINDGHELASHTFSHISCRSISADSFRRDIEQGRTAIKELTGHDDSGNFAFPFGDVTLSTKRAIGMELRSCRTIWGGVNGPDVDLSALLANRLYGDDRGLGAIQDLISANDEARGWLIFYTHDIRENPSPFGCTPSFFDSVVNLSCRKNSRVMTVASAISEISKPRPQVVSGNQLAGLGVGS